MALAITPVYIMVDEFVLKSSYAESIFQNGIIVFFLFLILMMLYGFLLKRKYKATEAEIVQGIFIYLVVSFIILTITGIVFRGEGMALTLP